VKICLWRQKQVKSLNEDELLRLARSGDGEAFARLVQIHAADAYRTAFFLLRNRQEAEDVVQEAFLTCYQKLGKFRLESSFKTWLYRIVVNISYDRLRKMNRESKALGRLSQASEPESGGLACLEERLDLSHVISTLSREQRMVLLLYYGLDFSVNKVAEILSIPVGTVKSRLNAARQLLKERLERGRHYGM